MTTIALIYGIVYGVVATIYISTLLWTAPSSKWPELLGLTFIGLTVALFWPILLPMALAGWLTRRYP